MVSPPLPISRPILSVSILTLEIRGACGERCAAGPSMTAFIWARMSRRASRAWVSASRRMSNVTPVILMSIWIAVMPSSVPATLKSMSPRWSSTPAMSVRTV